MNKKSKQTVWEQDDIFDKILHVVAYIILVSIFGFLVYAFCAL